MRVVPGTVFGKTTSVLKWTSFTVNSLFTVRVERRSVRERNDAVITAVGNLA